MKEVSIVIPHYNSPTMLEILLNSIPNIPEIQVIVVDDRSTEYIQEFKILQHTMSTRNIEFYRNEGFHKGAGVARNIGISYAQGEWLLFADADDTFVKGFYDILKNYFSLDVDIVYFTPTSLDLRTRQVSHRHRIYEELIAQYLQVQTNENEIKLRYFYHSPCSKMIRKSLIINWGIEFDNSLVANDIMFSIKSSYYGKQFLASKEVIYCISVHEQGLTRNLTEEKFDVRLRIEMDKYDFLSQRLSKEDVELLDINILQYIMMLRTHELGQFKKYLEVIRVLRRKNIPMVEKALRNPRYVLKKIITKLALCCRVYCN